MTKKEREHKIKLIGLILIVNAEYAKRKPFNHFLEIIEFTTEQVFWFTELNKLIQQKTFKKGGIMSNNIAIVNYKNKK